MSNALFIRTPVIGAIEAGDWDNLPHPVYVKGYVTQYAAFLNILDLLESETSREDGSLVQGPGLSTRKEGILRGWKFRKKRAIAEKQLSDGRSDFYQSVADRPVETNSSNEGEGNVVNIAGEESTWPRIGMGGRGKKEFVLR